MFSFRQILEQFVFLLLSMAVLSTIYSEEPVINLSDFNATDLFLITLSALSVLFDMLKGVEKRPSSVDAKATSYSFYHFNFLFSFSFVIWVGFFAHTISIISDDLCDGLIVWPNVLFSFSSLLSKTVFLSLLVITLSTLLVRLLEKSKINISILIILLSSFYFLLIHLIDLLSLSSTLTQKIYSSSNTLLTNTSSLYAQGGDFDWFKAQNNPLLPFLFDSALLFSLFFNIVILILVLIFLVVESLLFSLGLTKIISSLRSLIISLGLVIKVVSLGILATMTLLSLKLILSSIIFSLL